MAKSAERLLSHEKASGKHFYQRFQIEYTSFYQAIQGITVEAERRTYATLLLRRLMVLYFLQGSGLLDYDTNYLSKQLSFVKEQLGENRFYRDYLLPLFHEHLGKSSRNSQSTPFVGNVPALALPLFQIHPIEYTLPDIQIPDAAFAQIFAFFDLYQWKLTGVMEPWANELYAEILGDIFAQQINQKQMGAYYTKDDVTTYIATRTLLPCLLNTIAARYPQEFAPGSALWQLLQHRPERYIAQTVRNEKYLLRETKREYEERQSYYQHLFALLKTGKLQSIDDLITYNLDIERFVRDGIAQCQNAGMLLAFYQEIEQMSILDPTCGSGAFLLAATNTLEPLYTDCLNRLQDITDIDAHFSFPITSQDACFNREDQKSYHEIRKKVEEYPTPGLFVLSMIFSHNLYGVDIMEEAADLCKLRLFLALVGCSTRIEDVPAFSSIKWNIIAGNALIGQVHWFERFPEIMQRGGFDVIIGNPPYVEYNSVKQEYKVVGEGRENFGNLYAAIVARSLELCRPGKSYLGLIVPLSICGSERFRTLRSSLVHETAGLWISNFEIFPSRLFEGAFQRLSLLIARQNKNVQCTTYVTKIQRWYTVERPYLIDLLRYVVVHQVVKAEVFPKLASPLHETILHKLHEKAQGHKIATLLHIRKTEYFVYYQEATNYWMKATCSVPYYKKNGVMMEPAHGRFLYFGEQRMARVIMAIMNSSLFYLWFATFSDGFHLSHGLVKDFPLGEELYASEELEQLALDLTENIKIHANMSTRNTKFFLIELEEYRLSRSKGLLDEIDMVLGRYYGLSDAEVEFVVSYDEKYRMGHKNRR